MGIKLSSIHFPKHCSSLLKRFGIVLFFMMLSRIIFYMANKDSFTEVFSNDFLAALAEGPMPAFLSVS